MRRKNLIVCALCLSLLAGCNSKTNSSDISKLTENGIFQYDDVAFTETLDDVKESHKTELDKDNQIVLADTVSMYGLSDGKVSILSDPTYDDKISSVTIVYDYTGDNNADDSQKAFDKLFDLLSKEVPKDCETIDYRQEGDGATYIEDNLAPTYTWVDGNGNKLKIQQAVYESNQTSQVTIKISDKNHNN